MSGGLYVSEYLPRSVIRIKRYAKLLLMAGFVLVVAVFYIQMQAAAELRAYCNQMEDTAIRYNRLVEKGDAACEAGEKRQGERCYLTALQIYGGNPDTYLKLSQIYREYRRYDLALGILEEYPGKDDGIAAALEALKREIEQMEVSKFKEMEE